MAVHLALLKVLVQQVQESLNEYEPPGNGEPREAKLTASGKLLVITNLPLPDGWSPDYVDVVIDVSSLPPKGIYVLNDGFNGQEAALRQKFNLFKDAAYHEAEAIPGYTWICHIYPGNRWHLDIHDPARGDNLRKYLALFLAKLES